MIFLDLHTLTTEPILGMQQRSMDRLLLSYVLRFKSLDTLGFFCFIPPHPNTEPLDTRTVAASISYCIKLPNKVLPT